MSAAGTTSMRMALRCPRSEDAERCRLPAGHFCDHLFVGEPLTQLQAIYWREEQQLREKRARR